MRKRLVSTLMAAVLAAGTLVGCGASCYQAMCDAAEEYGYETAYTENVDTSEYVSVLTGYADLGYDLIFAPGSEYSDAVKQVSEEYPDVKFCLLNGTFSSDNVVSVMPDANQIGYMAGALAGLMTNTNYIGFIGGMELDTTQAKLDAYEAAAKGKEIASSMMSTYDVDVLFGDAGAVDTGAREALAEEDNHYSIGQPGDLGSEEDTVIICSVVTDNAALLKQCMQAMEDGNISKSFDGNDIYAKIIRNLPTALEKYRFSSVREVVETELKTGAGTLERKTPVFNGAHCVHCGLCVKVCPFFAIEDQEEKPVVDISKCMGCGLCRSRCPKNVISGV